VNLGRRRGPCDDVSCEIRGPLLHEHVVRRIEPSDVTFVAYHDSAWSNAEPGTDCRGRSRSREHAPGKGGSA